MPRSADDDDTIVIRPNAGKRAAPSRPATPHPTTVKKTLPLWLKIAPPAAIGAAALAGVLVWLAHGPTPIAPSPQIAAAPPQTAPPLSTPEPQPAPKAEPTVLALQTQTRSAAIVPAQPAVPPPIPVITATEQHILDHGFATGDPPFAVFRFAANPRILVVDFASLKHQGRMLNRAAAFVEKTGLPHDRVLTEQELDAFVRRAGDNADTFYYGHDYGAGALARFFALADRDNIRNSEEEETLRRLMHQEGWFEPDAVGGLISLPRVGADAHVTVTARATILHHELSHGEYFANPAYAAHVRRFWASTLTAAERDRMRRHLHTLGYDSSLEDVMANEAQAYLMFTDNPDFFVPAEIGMSKIRLTELRITFHRAMPAGWLKDVLGLALPPARPSTVAR